MTKVEYLTKRGETFYVRIKVPDARRAEVGGHELKRSLRTKSKTEAIKMYPSVVAELLSKLKPQENIEPESPVGRSCDLAALFQKVFADTQATEIEMRERVYRCLSSNQTEEKLFGFHSPVPSAYRPYLDLLMDEGNIAEIASFLTKVRGKYRIKSLRNAYQIGDVSELRERAREAAGFNPDRQLLHSIMKTLMDAEIAALEGLSHPGEAQMEASADTSSSPPVEKATKLAEQGPVLSDATKRWSELHSWEPKTRRERETVMGYFVEICGYRQVGSYTKEDGKKARDIFRSIPPNAHKMNMFRSLNILRISEKAQDGDFKLPAPKNVNDKLNVISAFFNWAQNEYDEVTQNPIQGLKLRLNQRARDQREPFTISELNQLFRSSVYTGCRSVKQWSVPGKLILKDSHLFWVPLIALFTGMRLSEIVFLETEDVEQVDGVLCFRVRETESRRLKTASSKRDIPVHSALIKMGFVDFVDQQRQRGGRLFEHIEIGPEDNRISPESKRMNRLLQKAGLTRDKTSFHSFRHVFEDGCRNSGIPTAVMNALQGHSERGMADRYGSGYSIKVLNENLQKLHYEGLCSPNEISTEQMHA